MSPDFNRDVHCLLGLPFDAVDMAGAVARVRGAITSRRPCFLSTPNLNFAVTALADPAFRDSVLHSDLSLADGMPLVWVARLLGIPLAERVAGASLFERLHSSTGTPIKVFFFGGPDGVAELACARLGAHSAGMQCVGFEAPGFGSVESMSGDDCIARINASGADFLVVSLGARKGQAWIEHNLHRLRVPVVSHLGAVVNFVAGTVRRAPPWMGRLGLEWLWRIREEPALWRRYGHDGMALLCLIATRVFPQWLHERRHAPSPAERNAASVHLTDGGNAVVLTLRGAWVGQGLTRLRSTFAQAANDEHSLQLDLRELSHLDSAVLGLLSLLWSSRVQHGRPWTVLGVHPLLQHFLHCAGAGYLMQPPAPPRAVHGAAAEC